MRIIGLMSGTSFDAIDAAAADVWSEDDTILLRPLGMISQPYTLELEHLLRGALPPNATTLQTVCQLDTAIGQEFAAVAAQANRQLCNGQADVIASHGQTVFHWVSDGQTRGTLQLGQPAWIAHATGCTVVSDFRARDVAAGGHGAPLVSIFDALWLRGRAGTPVALNLGGIANITVLRADGVLAYDTGPANALIDAAVNSYSHGRETFDLDGAWAARGDIDQGLLDRLLREPYYRRKAPKTTGKELFHAGYLDTVLDDSTTRPEDVVATLTELTARTVADQVRAQGGDAVLASGGGVRNPTLMASLARHLAPQATVTTTDDVGLPSDAKECYAFALLGYLTLSGLPGTIAQCTGATSAQVLGSITPGSKWSPEPRRATTPTRLELVPWPATNPAPHHPSGVERLPHSPWQPIGCGGRGG